MIVIAGSPFQIAGISGGYPENSVERQLLEQMSQSAEVYRYDTVEQLEFELALRREIVDAAKALNRSGLEFAVFHKSECNQEYWDRTSNGGFRLKSGAKPADAIRDIFTNGRKYATECATAMVIVYYGALLEVFSEETFNRLFPSIYLMNWHELDPLLREVGMPRRVADILLGDRCYFRNPEVDPKTPELQGENVIVLPGGLYYGHGIGITDADQIIRILNANRKEGATQSAYFMEDTAARPDFKRLEEASRSRAARPAVLSWDPFPPPLPRRRIRV
ncbi:MAG: Protein-glutamine gamma-glutamyltransferase [Firmicutes bacterium ADurb.Bin248]|jgi:protein-glutamine gamma-glutamyltransferase|nr:MAG: Protein-glutamine gamma-glutamyltransferase [Firmicutes bacterium ADurb.Bin248]HOF99658.1 protein-glutamine gamma-glutamyltransferase [Clostridia bacterium]HPK15894.1 protein-glutamine gamma-glutamyltransferase [Clostridia bacterium]